MHKSYPFLYTYQDSIKEYFKPDNSNKGIYHDTLRSIIKANGYVITEKMIENNPDVKTLYPICQSCSISKEYVFCIGKSYSEFGSDDYMVCEECLTKTYQLMKNTKKDIKMHLMSSFDDITEFQGDYRWLSNFSPCEIYLDGEEYRSVEHAYMSAKSDSPDWKAYCRDTESPGLVKRESKRLSVKENWNTIKLDIMAKCLTQKFNQEPYKSKLLATGERYIQEGNKWGDTFWGVDLKTGKGQNMLGTIIMNIRSELLKNSKPIVVEENPIGNDFATYMNTGKLPD